MKIPATFTGVASKVDGSLSLRFASQELPVADKVKIMELVNSFGWLVFSINDTEEIPQENAPDERKSPSQAYRDVLFVYYKQQGGDPARFNLYYRKHMAKITEELKEKLND